MSHPSKTASNRAAGGDPGLRIYGSDEQDVRAVPIEITRPGRFLLTQWTDDEWQALSWAQKPAKAYRQGKVWFDFRRVEDDP